MKKNTQNENLVIELAWCDKTSFEEIEKVTGLSESETIMIMRNNLKPSSFRLWRKRVSGRIAKHKKKKVDLDKNIDKSPLPDY
jgi:uncharacterized protein (TIGR03643 family)|tara:strand:- start:1763 stop:2011 length:249 start_codon:yes stop_codon:yes gene_type:complete